MKLSFVFMAIGLILSSSQSLAANADAREIARINNCTPKKIEVFKQTLGANGNTIYRVECIVAKSKDENAAKTADAMLVGCQGSLCEIVRPVSSSEK